MRTALLALATGLLAGCSEARQGEQPPPDDKPPRAGQSIPTGSGNPRAPGEDDKPLQVGPPEPAEPGKPQAPSEDVLLGANLNEDQRVAWRKFQRNAGKGYHVVILSGNGWRARSENGSLWSHRLESSGKTFQGLPLADAELAAQKAAALTSVKVVVVLDLLSGPDPKLICWFYDDGSGPKKLAAAPKPEYRDGLREFLVQLQTDGVN